MNVSRPPLNASYDDWVDYEKILKKINTNNSWVQNELKRCSQWFDIYDKFISECG